MNQLHDNLAAPAVSVQVLEAFADAWCRHDVDALMACMADDCVFHTSAGPEASGAMRTVMGADPDRSEPVSAGVIGGRFVRLDPVAMAPGPPVDPAAARHRLQRELTAHAGVLRDAASLDAALTTVTELLAAPRGDAVADHELHNLATVGRAAVAAAARREESRGAHTRDDFPDSRPEFAHHWTATHQPQHA